MSLSRRALMGITAMAVIPIGLFIRFLPWGLGADLAGGVLYAVLIYLLVAFLAPKARPSVIAGIAAAWCLMVELLQLTDVPRLAATAFAPTRLVFGTSFAALDLVAYAAGLLAAWGCDRFFGGQHPSTVTPGR